jgi:ubiquinol-cytochrome c reductase cytochrome c1 subunit
VKNLIKLLSILAFISIASTHSHSAETAKLLKTDWSFKGLFGKFDRGSLQRGYQVYTEVCAACHSMKYLSYRNLGEKGGPEFSEAEVKAIAASFEVTDGPNADPPDMSVLVKARGGGVDYIYSLLQGYEDAPSGMILDEGVHYNKYMYGNKIRMSAPLSDDIVEYGDGTKATVEQMSKDVTTFLMWAAEPHLESRHQMGFKAIIYLIILTILVYFSMKKIWSRVESEV